MITEEHIDAMHAFDRKAKAEFIRFLDTLSDEPYEAAAALILKSAAAGGRSLNAISRCIWSWAAARAFPPPRW